MTTKTNRELDADIRAAVKRGHGDTTTEASPTCNTCGRPKASPFRRYDKHGKVVEGCINAAHNDQLYGESLRWHMRPEAKKFRASMVARLKAMLSGKVKP